MTFEYWVMVPSSGDHETSKLYGPYRTQAVADAIKDSLPPDARVVECPARKTATTPTPRGSREMFYCRACDAFLASSKTEPECQTCGVVMVMMPRPE